MPLDLSTEVLVRAASGGFLILLGAFVAWVRPRTRASASFAGFSAAFGLQFVLTNAAVALGRGDPVRAPLHWAASMAFLAATVALGVLATSVPGGTRRDERSSWVLPVAVVGLHGAAGLLVMAGSLGDVASWSAGIADEVGEFANRVFILVFQLLLGALFGALVLFAVDYRVLIANRPEKARSLHLISAALLLYPAYNAGESLATYTGVAATRGTGITEGGAAVFLLQGWLGVASCALLAGLWLANTRASPGSRGCRDLALLALAVPLGAFLVERWAPNLAGVGVVRLLSVGLFAYAIVRRQLFDLDLKVKWTLRQSTVVASFVAAFFIVSELTAAFLTQTIGTVMGIVAAGALLFVLAPLQRLADRVSDRAMPGVRDTADYRWVRKREVYRAAVESAAAADGEITEKERDMLATLVDQLGLTATDARGVEREVLASTRRAA